MGRDRPNVYSQTSVLAEDAAHINASTQDVLVDAYGVSLAIVVVHARLFISFMAGKGRGRVIIAAYQGMADRASCDESTASLGEGRTSTLAVGGGRGMTTANAGVGRDRKSRRLSGLDASATGITSKSKKMWTRKSRWVTIYLVRSLVVPMVGEVGDDPLFP